MTNMVVKKILLDAAQIVEEGWTKRLFWNPDTNCHCLNGAIMRACGVEFNVNGGTFTMDGTDIEISDYDVDYVSRDVLILFNAADHITMELLRAETDQYSTIAWNDRPEVTQADVAAFLRRAAERA